MRQSSNQFNVASRGKGLHDFTRQVEAWVRDTGIREGLLTLFVQHTSASLLVQENADPDVRGDLERFLSRLVPENDPIYRHTLEGPDDSSSHLRAALLPTSLSIPVESGRLVLGRWQGIYLVEHRSGGQQRTVRLDVLIFTPTGGVE